MTTATPAATCTPGASLHGFEIVRVTPVPELRAMAYEAVHTRSGARLLHVHATDAENLFAVAFRTPPPDDTGLPHILEHTVLCGSARYPVKDPFVEMLKMSLATFLNAMTYPDKTVYPCASQNKQDFFNLAGVYCDAVFFPLLTEEHFKQEGHHLAFTEPGNPASPLIVKGIVYNEMKGAFSDLDGMADRHGGDLFPDTAYGRVSGGDPDAIPTLTYGAFKAFHERFYHPSNAWFFLYGDIPTERHLAFLDREYLNRFTRQKIDTTIAPQPRWRKPRRVTVPYPAAPGDRPADKSAFILTFLANPITDGATTYAMDILDYYLLGNAASPLRKALIDARLGEELTHAGYGAYQRETVFGVGLKGTAPERAPAIEKLVRETLRRLVKEGLAHDKLETAFHRLELETREIPSHYPLRLMDRVYNSWLYDEDPLLLLEAGRHLAALRARWQAEPHLFERLIERYLLDNPHYTATTYVPDAELLDKQTAARRRKLDKQAARLSAGERQRILAEAAALDRLQAAPNSPEALATLPRLALRDVPREPDDFATTLAPAAGRPFLVSDVFANGINHLELALDFRDFDDDAVLYLPLLTEALGKMGAAGQDYAALAEREAACSGGIGAGLVVGGTFDDPDAVQPFLTVYARALDDKLDTMLGVLTDRLLACDFSDLNRLRDVILQGRIHRRNNLVPAGNRYAALYAQQDLSRNARLLELTGGFTQVRFFERLAGDLDKQLAPTAARLAALRDRLLERERLTASFVGGEAPCARAQAWYARTVAGLRAAAAPAVAAAAAVPAAAPRRSGMALPSDVAFVAQAGRAVGAAHPLSAALLVLSQSLSLGYLWNEVRARRGAYGCSASYAQSCGLFACVSYRDPCVRETLDTYAGIMDHVAKGMDLSPAAVEQAVIGTLKALDQPVRPGAAVHTALVRHLTGVTYDRRQRFRTALLAVDGAALRQVAQEVLAPALRDSRVCIVAGRARLEAANRELPGRELVIETLEGVGDAPAAATGEPGA